MDCSFDALEVVQASFAHDYIIRVCIIHGKPNVIESLDEACFSDYISTTVGALFA